MFKFHLLNFVFSPLIKWFFSSYMSFHFIFFCFFCFFHQLVAVYGCSLVFVWTIQTTVLFRSDKEVILNPYSSVYFIKPRILDILSILGSGMKISDISVDISPIYPISVMFDTISAMTDRYIVEISSMWHTRALV